MASDFQDPSVQPEPLDTWDFYQGYRERLEHKLRHKNTQIARTERLIPTLPEAQRPAFQSMLKQALGDLENIRAELQDIYRMIDELKASGK